MSHEIKCFSYDVTKSKTEIENDINEYVSKATWQEGGGGLYRPIRWIDKTYESWDEARNNIEMMDDGDYCQLAVKYKEYGTVDKSKLKKYNELSTKCKEAHDKVDKLERTNHFKDLKSAYIGCPHCNSKINREVYVNKRTLMRANCCPVCGESMLKDTMLKQIEAAKEKHRKLQDQAQAEYRKQQLKNKPKDKWLVKIEYHV